MPSISKLESTHQLPLGGSVLNIKDRAIGVEEGLLAEIVVWRLAPRGGRKQDESAPTKTWIIGTYEFMHSTARMMGIVQRLRGAGYEVVDRRIADTATIQAIYEIQEQSSIVDETWRNTDVNKFLNDIVAQAIANKVSDIHIEKRQFTSRIRWRRNGKMDIFKNEIGSSFITRLCQATYNVEAGEEGKQISFRDSEPQAAVVPRNIDGEDINLRFQSIPAFPRGFDVVLRILPVGREDDTTYQDLADLGYSPDQKTMLQEIVARPIGVLVVSGVTGSGKSTTLRSLVLWINDIRHGTAKIYTIEDPPEYRIAVATQIPVRQRTADELAAAKGPSPFEEPLKAVMRGDPDVIMIGEIRDNQTADGMKKATQSGHQVLTTVHAPSAISTVSRLRDLGLDAATMGAQDFLTGLVYQRLIPTLCPDCAQPFLETVQKSSASTEALALSRRLQKVLGEAGMEAVRVQGRGCNTCRQTGIIGRTVCAEIIQPDLRMLRYFTSGAMIDAYEYWRSLSDGDPLSDRMRGKTVLEHAIWKISRGLVSPYDVEEMIDQVDQADKLLNEMKAAARERQAATQAAPPAAKAAPWAAGG